MKSIHSILISGILVTVVIGCEPQPDDLTLLDQFVVSTNFDPDANFSSYTTYYMPLDTIGLVSNVAGDDSIIVGSSYARPVITQVKNNLNSRGFQSVGINDDPDLAINAYVLKNLNIFQQTYYPGSYGYPGYYYPGYYGYYGYNYYPYVNTYAYNTGVLVVEIVDLKNKTAQNTVKVIWDAYLGDVFSSVDLSQQTLDGIDQAFLQSPYLIKQ
jgi:Domain of unknown function (DUF4136)